MVICKTLWNSWTFSVNWEWAQILSLQPPISLFLRFRRLSSTRSVIAMPFGGDFLNHWCLYWCLWHISLHFVWKPYIRTALLWWYHISKVKRHWINGVVCLCIILCNCARHNSSILCVVVSQPSSLKRLSWLVNFWAPVTILAALYRRLSSFLICTKLRHGPKTVIA